MEQNLTVSASHEREQKTQRHGSSSKEEQIEGNASSSCLKPRVESKPQAENQPFEEINQIKILQEALLEVFGQNEKLVQRVNELEAENAAKDRAIAELAAALDMQTGGCITKALDQM